MSAEKQLSEGQRRLMAVVEAMGRRPLDPVSAADLASEIGCTRDQAYRTLRSMESMGWAWNLKGSSLWRLGPRIIQLSDHYRIQAADECRKYLGAAA